MGWETIKTTGSGDNEERERLATKIGSRIEGTVRRVGDRCEGKYGDVRWIDIDTLDGVRGTFPARGVLLSTVERAELSPGDQVRMSFEAKETKNGNTMNLPSLQVNRAAAAVSGTSADDQPDF